MNKNMITLIKAKPVGVVSSVLFFFIMNFQSMVSAQTLMQFQKFTIDVKDTYKEKALHFLVPDNAKTTSLPLMIFLHGGGGKSPSGAPLEYLKRDTREWDGFFKKSGAVVVAPHVIDSRPSGRSWNPDPVIEEYLANVILESKKRFNIDPDRVFLVGWSMGGLGAYNIAINYPDRFAGIIAGAGTWRYGDFRNALTGNIPIYLIHGEKDASYKKRAHFTDIQEARLAAESMKKAGVDVRMLVNSKAGHFPEALKQEFHQAWNAIKKQRRKLKHVFISTPSGTYGRYDKRHRGWVTIDKVKPGKVAIDMVEQIAGVRGDRKWKFSQEEFDAYKLRAKRLDVKGAWVDAAYEGGNVFRIKTKNVSGLTVRMNSEMVNYSKPVIVYINGKKCFGSLVKPNKKNAEEFFSLHKNTGLVYDGKISFKEL